MGDVMPIRISLDWLIHRKRRESLHDFISGASFPRRVGIFLQDGVLKLPLESVVFI
jgi:hypothetical protein